MRRLLFPIPWFLILACAAPSPTPAPRQKMDRVAYRDVSPGVEADSPAGQMHSLFRVGRQIGRIDYPPNPDDGTHAAVIVLGPQVWVIDFERRTAVETRDPGPSHGFRAPVLEARDHPHLRALEFGREFDFLEEHGVEPARIESADGTQADRYELAIEDLTVVLIASPGSRVARELQIFRGGELYRAFHYDAYELDLVMDATLFRPPANMQPAEPVR